MLYTHRLISWRRKATVSSAALFVIAASNAMSMDGASTPGGSLSLRPEAWDILFSHKMPAHPLPAEGRGWSFDFPVCGDVQDCSVHYVNTPASLSLKPGQTLKATFTITTVGSPRFIYQPYGGCNTPANTRLFLQRGVDLTYDEFDRWWAKAAVFTLAAGKATLTATLVPEQWSSVEGKSGNDSATAKAGFAKAIENVSRIGLTFGGGCNFGHGVAITGDAARFTLTEFSVGPEGE